MTAKFLQKKYPKEWAKVYRFTKSEIDYQVKQFPINKALENIAFNFTFESIAEYESRHGK
jgi:hypothetical protein